MSRERFEGGGGGAGATVVVEVCLMALPSSHELTRDAKRRVQRDSWREEACGSWMGTGDDARGGGGER
jgi:hypothetical protein